MCNQGKIICAQTTPWVFNYKTAGKGNYVVSLTDKLVAYNYWVEYGKINKQTKQKAATKNPTIL